MKGCDICNAKQRMRVSYGRKMLCGECYYEYRMIFEGILKNRYMEMSEEQRRIDGISENP